MKIAEIGEFGLIEQIASKFKNIIPPSCRGIGDDCAVIPISDGQSMVITTDMLVEDIHFLRSKISAYQLGYKSLAVNLSDIAAMGAAPHSTFLSISLPSDIESDWCSDFMSGYRAHNVALLGGDTTKSTDKIVINVTALGMADNSNLKFRNGAKPGQHIYVTAPLGDSAAGLRAILAGKSHLYPELVQAHNMPSPHLTQGLALGSNSSVGAMMDVSDGVASDLRHILRASGVGAQIDLSRIPMTSYFNQSEFGNVELALTGGEDYCLLFTASADSVLDSAFDCFDIGYITTEHVGQITWTFGDKIIDTDIKGFTHF